MKNILIISLGILVLSVLAIPANAQTLKADNVDFFAVFVGVGSTNADVEQMLYSLSYNPTPPLKDIFSVTMPSTKDPKWTIVSTSGVTIVTTSPVLLMYRPKSKGSEADQVEPE